MNPGTPCRPHTGALIPIPPCPSLVYTGHDPARQRRDGAAPDDPSRGTPASRRASRGSAGAESAAVDASGVANFRPRRIALGDPPVAGPEPHALVYTVAGVADDARVPVTVLPSAAPCAARAFRGDGAAGVALPAEAEGGSGGFVAETPAGNTVSNVFFRCVACSGGGSGGGCVSGEGHWRARAEWESRAVRGGPFFFLFMCVKFWFKPPRVALKQETCFCRRGGGCGGGRFFDEAGRPVALRAEDGWRAEWPKPARPGPLVATAEDGVRLPPLKSRERAGDSDTHVINFVWKGKAAEGRTVRRP